MPFSNFFKMMDYKTINVEEKDKLLFKKLTLKYRTNQIKLFHALVKVANKFKPELDEYIK